MIGDKIKILREEKGLTQKQVAQYLGLSPSSISDFERNKREVKHEYIIKLAEYFKTSQSYLISSEESVNMSKGMEE